ncbi:MAG: insulinase family protein, partial [Patescibacteria group bacterium]
IADETFEKIGKAFGKMTRGKKIEKPAAKERQSGPQVKFKKKDVDQTHVRIGVRAYDMFDERRYALNVLQTILGGNWSSRLWTELREKLGLTYYVNASQEEYTDTGYLLASAGVPHRALPRVAKKIVEVFHAAKTKGVSDKELSFAKEYLRGSMALQFESTDEVATFLASQELFYGKIMTPEEILKKVEKVSKGDIMKVARDIFRPGRINLAAIGPEAAADEYKKILAQI